MFNGSKLGVWKSLLAEEEERGLADMVRRIDDQGEHVKVLWARNFNDELH